MRFVPIALTAILWGTLSACSTATVVATRTLTKADNGQKVTVATGACFRVVLAANHTTGWAWRLGALDAGVVDLIGPSVYTADPAPEGMVGVGGNEAWTFAAKQPGQQTIRLGYGPSWQKDQPAANTVTFVIEVK